MAGWVDGGVTRYRIGVFLYSQGLLNITPLLSVAVPN